MPTEHQRQLEEQRKYREWNLGVRTAHEVMSIGQSWSEMAHTPESYRTMWNRLWSTWDQVIPNAALGSNESVSPFPYDQAWIDEQEREGRVITYVPPKIAGSGSTEKLLELFKFPDTSKTDMVLWSEDLFDLFSQSGWMAVDGIKNDVPYDGRLATEEQIIQALKDGTEFATINSYLIASLFSKATTGLYLDDNYPTHSKRSIDAPFHDQMPIVGTLARSGTELMSDGKLHWRTLRASVAVEEREYQSREDTKLNRTLDISADHRFNFRDDKETGPIVFPRKVHRNTPLPTLAHRLYIRDVESYGIEPNFGVVMGAISLRQQVEIHKVTSEDKGFGDKQRTKVFAVLPLSTDQTNEVIGQITTGFDPIKLEYDLAQETTVRSKRWSSLKKGEFELASLHWTEGEHTTGRHDKDQYSVVFYPNEDLAFLGELIQKYGIQKHDEKKEAPPIEQALNNLHYNRVTGELAKQRHGIKKEILKKYVARLNQSEELNNEVEEYLNSITQTTNIEEAAFPSERQESKQPTTLRELQAKSGLTPADFAKTIDVSPATYYALTSGRAVTLSDTTIGRIHQLEEELEAIEGMAQNT